MANWYYYDNNQLYGPVSAGDLQLYINSGQIKPDTIIQHESGRKCMAKNVKGLIFPGQDSNKGSYNLPNSDYSGQSGRDYTPEIMPRQNVQGYGTNGGTPHTGFVQPTQIIVQTSSESASERSSRRKRDTTDDAFRMAMLHQMGKGGVSAGCLSFFIPGLGQIANGRALAGLAWMAALLVLSLLSCLTGFILSPLAFIAWLICIYDAASGSSFNLSGKNNMGCIIAIVLIGLIAGIPISIGILVPMKEAIDKAKEQTQENSEKQEETSAPQSPVSNIDWVPADKSSAHSGDFEVSVNSVKCDYVQLKRITSREAKTSQRRLQIEIEITNNNKEKKYELLSWRYPCHAVSALLEDDKGNTYKPVVISGAIPEGGFQKESIYPEKTLSDILVFEMPVKGIKYLRLTLPGENCQMDDSFHIEIPGVMIPPESN